MKELIKRLAENVNVKRIYRSEYYDNFEVITTNDKLHKFRGVEGLENFLNQLENGEV